jgi:hypothetical protein
MDVAQATQTTGKQMEELGFFTRHISGGELKEIEVSELGNKGEALGYEPGAVLFGGEDRMVMRMLDSDESKIVRNITRSIGFPNIEEKLYQVKRRKLSHNLAYTCIKVLRVFILIYLYKIFIF